jgi:hypothetical protein
VIETKAARRKPQRAEHTTATTRTTATEAKKHEAAATSHRPQHFPQLQQATPRESLAEERGLSRRR